jgi:hypothetical protein
LGEKKVLFESEELKNRFEDLKDFCKQYEIDCYHDGISILEEEEDEEEYSTLRLNTNSEIIVYLPNEAEDLLELSDLIQFWIYVKFLDTKRLSFFAQQPFMDCSTSQVDCQSEKSL